VNEAELTRDCIRRLNKLPGCFAVKVHGSPYQRRGLPDIVGCLHGQFFGIEMKMPGKEANLTDNQKNVLAKIRHNGGRAGVATSYKECMEVINDGSGEATT
jgi:Holliday junction resolvase